LVVYPRTGLDAAHATAVIAEGATTVRGRLNKDFSPIRPFCFMTSWLNIFSSCNQVAKSYT